VIKLKVLVVVLCCANAI